LTLAAALFAWPPTLCLAQDNASPPLVEPNFLLPADPEASDYRPVLNADATVVVYERTFSATNIRLYFSHLPPMTGDPQPFAPNVGQSSRADWCWDRSHRSLMIGPVAFSNDNGIYVSAGPGAAATLLPDTAGMIYPSWYSNCKHIAADVSGTQVTAKIDAATGKTIVPVLANQTVWAGFPSVNQVNPDLIAFAGQFNRDSNYYDQDLNYTWVTDRTRRPPRVAPMDRDAPVDSGFLQTFQARAGWWSPDGRWFAFESNRICNDIEGQTYAIFVQDSTGVKPAMQVSDCNSWNVQHPKWFPPGPTGVSTMLIAAVAQPGMNEPFAIANFDVSAFVGQR
jgi:WD40-like Beta Propeller Repeat